MSFFKNYFPFTSSSIRLPLLADRTNKPSQSTMEELSRTSLVFPQINATLNGISAILLLIGFFLVKNRKLEAHKKVMWAAFGFSAAFLASYLYYHFNYTSNRFGGVGAIRYVYFTLLISHIILATVMLPFILRLLWLGSKGSNEKHRRLARYVWPVWMYSSVTGVLIYFMLYEWFPGAPR